MEGRVMVNQSNFTELHGVQIFVVPNATELKDSHRVPQQGTQKRVLVMDSPSDARKDLIADIEASLAFVDEYIFCYQPESEHIKRYEDSDDDDIEPDSIERFPRLIGSRLQIDVPYEFARNREHALRKAWRRVQSGDTLIVITSTIDDTLDALRHISASVPRNSADRPSAPLRADEDPSS